MELPAEYYTVHLSYDQDQPPIYNSKKYYCKTYLSARKLAHEISDDKGYEIMEIISNSSGADYRKRNRRTHGSTSKYGGYNGFDDRTIDDAFE
jgi:hypothetical protein